MHRSYLNSLESGYEAVSSPNNREDSESNSTSVNRLHDSPINHDFCNVNVLTCLTSYVLRVLIAFVAYPFNILDSSNKESYIVTFWFYNALYGIIWGMDAAAFAAVTEEIEPKHHDARKIERSRLVINGLICAILVIAVGLQWDSGNGTDRLWHVQGAVFIVCFVLMMALLYGNKYKQRNYP